MTDNKPKDEEAIARKIETALAFAAAGCKCSFCKTIRSLAIKARHKMEPLGVDELEDIIKAGPKALTKKRPSRT